MTFALDRLESLRVGDVMNREVISVSAAQHMIAASPGVVEHGISGAPVIDEQGRCVGVISAADFVRREGAVRRGATSSVAGSPTVVRQEPHGPWEIRDVFLDHVS